MTGLGYRECVRLLRGELDRATAVELIKRDTRRFAKRQETFFRKMRGVRWVDTRAGESPKSIADKVLAVISET
jgi:tRNA dimethylallyltransferase